MKKILSIDGGGIRGIVPSMICAEIEKQSGQSIASQFDLIAVTSNGRIIALALASNLGASSLVTHGDPPALLGRH